MTNNNFLFTIQEIHMEHTDTFEIVRNFYVFEGLDGAGTTTQARLLVERLRQAGCDGQYTCEPTTGFIGETVRKVLRGEEQVAPGTLAKLFAADRHNHLYHAEEGIIPSARRGTRVVSDRYLFSSLAYQSLDWTFEQVWQLNNDFPLPEHLLFIDVPPEECGKRLARRSPEREIYERRELQEEIRDTYFHSFSLYRDSGMHIHIFDGTLSQEKLANCIWSKLSSFR
jgi:dTMP kinase